MYKTLDCIPESDAWECSQCHGFYDAISEREYFVTYNYVGARRVCSNCLDALSEVAYEHFQK